MKIVDVYCSDIQKRTIKLLKKMFGIKTIAEGLEERKHCKQLLEFRMNKSVDDFTVDDVTKNGYIYSRYRTLNNILELYLECVQLKHFTVKELEEYNECRRSRKN